jgi:hypothetical protein
MNWKGYGRKRSWFNLKLYHRIPLKNRKEKKATENLSQDNQAPGRDFKLRPPENEAKS